jgi:thiol-disulfide isomerase/thioredoxin
MTEADFDGIDAFVNQNKGKVVLLDVWATWCPPCQATFPEFVSLHKMYADKGLVCISMSLDKISPRPTYKPDAVLRFLKSNKATCRNFVLTGDPKKLGYYGYEGYIPFKLLIDKSGKHINVSGLDEEELVQRVQAELAKEVKTGP